MRMRATVVAASGALALSALTVPAAQADGPAIPDLHVPTAAEVFGSAAKAPAAAASRAAAAEPVVSKVVVNGGKNIVLGTTDSKKIDISVTASHPSGISDGFAVLWHGRDLVSEDGVDGEIIPNSEDADCKKINSTTSTCSSTYIINPRKQLYKNALAGTWHGAAGALAGDGFTIVWNDYATTARVQRLSRLTVNAAPEPVKKGGTITVTGKLSRANWEDHAYHGYTGQAVKLQFRKKGSSTYTTVKTIKTNSTGTLKTTVKASVDGYWRYSFGGTSTTPAVSAAGDFVDVK
ncbi:calcium-binding protein [Streptomyces sp. NPDC059970]|uniref:calcium-binding protein n=1 Tax=Streptomyces sp. NPDC059970 TaxID=3347019 RepID=UPI0036CC4B54